MANTAKLTVQIVTDASQAGAGIDQATSKFDGFKGTMSSLAGPAAIALGAVTAFGAGTVNAASDVQQAMGGIDAVFGDSAAQIKAWSDQSAESVGLSKSEYGNFATVIGAQLKNLGVPMEAVAGGTDDLIRLGADLAATYGGSTSEAVSALSSALRGEADPAERYGLALNQTAVNAELAAQGLTGLEGQAATAAKAQAILGLATEQAGGALGQYARESDTVAGAQSTLAAQTKDAAAALGESLLPVVQPIIAAFADMAGWIKQNATVITILVAAVGALAAGILLINGVMIAYNAILSAVKIAQAIATAAQWAWNAALTANPIGIIIAAVAALVAAFIYLWNTNEDFRNFFIGLWEGIASFFSTVWEGIVQVAQAVAQFFVDAWNVAVTLVTAYINVYATIFRAIFDGVKAVVTAVVNFFVSAWKGAVDGVQAVIKVLGDVFRNVMNAIMVPINWVVDAFNNVVNAIKNVINWLGRIKIPDVFGAIGNFFSGGGGARSVAAPAPSFTGFSARSAGVAPAPAAYAAAQTSPGTSIVVQGGLDSADAIARRIASLVGGRDRRTGGVVLTRAARA